MTRIALLASIAGVIIVGAPPTDPPARLRHPVALACADDGKLVFIANRHAGSISVVDTQRLGPIAEYPVGRLLADLVLTPDGKRLLAVDEEASEFILLTRRGPVPE